MLIHAMAVEQKEYEQALCHDHWHYDPRLHAEVEVPAVQLVGFRTTREEVQGLYNNVYQLQRLPGPPLYGPE